MRNFKLFTMILALMATICFAACDDKDDNKQETNVCEPASCKVDNATETGCNAGQCVAKACKDGFKVSDDKKSCEEVKESHKCDPAGIPACDPKCEDGNDCICREDRWQCVPVDDKDKCDPKCEDGVTKCVCTMDSCACAPVNPCNEKVEGDACGDGKTCQLDGEALSCKDKSVVPPTECDPKCEDGITKCECTMEACACVPVTPAPTCNPSCDPDTQDCVCSDSGCECKTKDAPVEDKCKDKSEGDTCDENKTCQKGDGDKLECNDAPAKDPEPAA